MTEFNLKQLNLKVNYCLYLFPYEKKDKMFPVRGQLGQGYTRGLRFSCIIAVHPSYVHRFVAVFCKSFFEVSRIFQYLLPKCSYSLPEEWSSIKSSPMTVGNNSCQYSCILSFIPIGCFPVRLAKDTYSEVGVWSVQP